MDDPAIHCGTTGLEHMYNLRLQGVHVHTPVYHTTWQGQIWYLFFNRCFVHMCPNKVNKYILIGNWFN